MLGIEKWQVSQTLVCLLGRGATAAMSTAITSGRSITPMEERAEYWLTPENAALFREARDNQG